MVIFLIIICLILLIFGITSIIVTNKQNERYKAKIQKLTNELEDAETHKSCLEIIQKKINQSELVLSERNQKIQSLDDVLKEKEQNKIAAELEVNYYQQRIGDLQKDFEESKGNAEKAAVAFKNQALDNAANIYCRELEEIQNNFKKAAQAAQDSYTALEAEMVSAYTNKLAKMAELSQERNTQYIDLCSKTKAAIEANKRAELEKEKKNFFQLQLSKEDLAEIAKIREIEPYLRDKSALNKVIWSVYYKKPTSDMTGRVVGSKPITGIYKITDIRNGRCYVGQAVNIAARWTQHIKRGLGAEAATKNKLYPAMQEAGPENFTFEIIEECPETALNRKEQEWQDYFGAKEFGYSER